MTFHPSGQRERQGESDLRRGNWQRGERMAMLNLRQYASHRGVALSAVEKAIQSDRRPAWTGVVIPIDGSAAAPHAPPGQAAPSARFLQRGPSPETGIPSLPAP